MIEKVGVIMIMTEAEICKEYRESKKQNMQIGILAELNLCKKAEIIQILEKNGITVPKPAMKKKAELPQEIREVLERDLETIEAQIKELEAKYKAIAAFLCEG